MATDVLIAGDSDFERNLLREILAEEFEVVAEAGNGVEAVDRYREAEPDVVLMDATMPIQDGIDATAEITEVDPGARVVVCARDGRRDDERRAKRAGARVTVSWPFQRDQVLAAVEDALTA